MHCFIPIHCCFHFPSLLWHLLPLLPALCPMLLSPRMLVLLHALLNIPCINHAVTPSPLLLLLLSCHWWLLLSKYKCYFWCHALMTAHCPLFSPMLMPPSLPLLCLPMLLPLPLVYFYSFFQKIVLHTDLSWQSLIACCCTAKALYHHCTAMLLPFGPCFHLLIMGYLPLIVTFIFKNNGCSHCCHSSFMRCYVTDANASSFAVVTYPLLLFLYLSKIFFGSCSHHSPVLFPNADCHLYTAVAACCLTTS